MDSSTAERIAAEFINSVSQQIDSSAGWFPAISVKTTKEILQTNQRNLVNAIIAGNLQQQSHPATTSPTASQQPQQHNPPAVQPNGPQHRNAPPDTSTSFFPWPQKAQRVVHISQSYRDCAPVADQLAQAAPLLKFVPVTANAPPVEQSNTLVYVFFTHTGRWIDDVRGQKDLQEMAPRYERIILVTLRATADVSSLPTLNAGSDAVRECMQGKTVDLAVYLLFEFRKCVFNRQMRDQYNDEAIKFNEGSLDRLVSTLSR